jgi:hypothetical protein
VRLDLELSTERKILDQRPRHGNRFKQPYCRGRHGELTSALTTNVHRVAETPPIMVLVGSVVDLTLSARLRVSEGCDGRTGESPVDVCCFVQTQHSW